MIECASRTFDPTITSLPWSAARKIESRRALHSTFWDPSAGDLELPLWWIAAVNALLVPGGFRFARDRLVKRLISKIRPRIHRQLSHSHQYSQNGHASLLNRLKSISLQDSSEAFKSLRRIATSHDFVSSRLRAKQSDTQVRPTSSLSSHQSFEGLQDHSIIHQSAGAIARVSNKISNTSSTNQHLEEPMEVRIGVDVDGSKAKEAVQAEQQVFSETSGRFTSSFVDISKLSSDAAWQHFKNIEIDDRTYDLGRQVMSTFSIASNDLNELVLTDSRRMIELYETTLSNRTNPEALHFMVKALILVGKTDEALEMHKIAMQHEIVGFDSTQFLIAHSLMNLQFVEAAQIWEIRKTNNTVFGTGDNWITWTQSMKEMILTNSRIEDRIYRAVRQASKTKSRTKVSASFLKCLVACAFENSLQFGPGKTSALLTGMYDLGFQRSYFYEVACFSSSYADLAIEEKKAMTLQYYRIFCTDDDYPPKLRIMHKIFDHAESSDDETTLLMLATEIKRSKNIKDARFTSRLMRWFAKRGQTDVVESLMDAHCAVVQKPRDVSFFHPFLHAYALRGNSISLQRGLRWLEDTFDFKPDLTCWNMLLQAYTRADDLQGAFDCFDRLLNESDLQPDHWTLGTLIAASASSGQTNLMNILINYVEEHKLKKTSLIIQSKVLAHIRNNECLQAEEIAKSAEDDIALQSKTRMWNQILIEYATKARFHDVDRVVHLMATLNVPLDTISYAAIMRSSVLNRQTERAKNILYCLLPKESLKPTALHYAILMDYFAKERDFTKGFKLHAEMIQAGIKPSMSSQFALFKLHVEAERSKIAVETVSHPGLRHEISEEVLEQMISNIDPATFTEAEPHIGLLGISTASSYPALMFDVLLRLYTKSKAFETIKLLIHKYQEMMQDEFPHDADTLSLRILRSIMEMRLQQGNVHDVAECWKIALQTATETSMSRSGIPISDDSPSGLKSILPGMQSILARHFDIYISSMNGKRDDILFTVEKYQNDGFVLDYRNWNWVVQALSQGSDCQQAFIICERELIYRFQGWNPDEKRPNYNLAAGKKSAGLYMQGRKFDMFDQRERLVVTNTLKVLSNVLKKLEGKARMDEKSKNMLFNLAKYARRTVQVIREMPPMRKHRFDTTQKPWKGEAYPNDISRLEGGRLHRRYSLLEEDPMNDFMRNTSD